MNPEYMFNQISGLAFALAGLTIIAGALTNCRVTCRMVGLFAYAPIGIVTATCGFFLLLNAGAVK